MLRRLKLTISKKEQNFLNSNKKSQMLKAALVFQRHELTTLYCKSLIDVAWGSSCALFTLASVLEPDPEIFVNAWTCFKIRAL